MIRDLRTYSLAALLALPLGQAHAAISGQVEVLLSIASGCQVSQGGSAADYLNQFGTLDFGQAGPTWSSALAAQLVGSGGGSLQVTCDPALQAFRVSVDGGLRGDRTLKHSTGSETVSYTLFQDAARQKPYAIDQAVSFPVADGVAVNVPLYGGIKSNATAKASGAYKDTLTVTLEF